MISAVSIMSIVIAVMIKGLLWARPFHRRFTYVFLFTLLKTQHDVYICIVYILSIIYIVPILTDEGTKAERLISLSRTLHMVDGRGQYVSCGLLGPQTYMNFPVS